MLAEHLNTDSNTNKQQRRPTENSATQQIASETSLSWQLTTKLTKTHVHILHYFTEMSNVVIK